MSILNHIKNQKNFKELKVLVWGYGVSGKATKDFLIKFGANVTVLDYKKAEGVDYSEQDFDQSLKFDLVVKSPGIAWEHPLVKHFQESKIEITGEMELVSSFSNVPIIAVTGSNGKSTTVNMLSFALKKLKIPHFMGGNWGLPYAEILLDPQYQNAKFAVLELSSFQLELVEDFAPLVACLLNITPNHMERYSNFKEYKEAKYKIATHAQYFFDCVDLEEFEQKFDLSKAKVKGKHNVSNFAFCYRALKAAGINCDDLFQKVIEDFPGIPHRLEYAGTYQGVRYYNDSKSTNVEATITALEAFPLKEKVHLILGGKNRSEDISEFKELLKFKNIESYRFFGQAASKLEKCFENNENIFKYHDLAQVMKDLKPKVGEIILFSPGFPSYDQYQNFNERGEHFKSLLASKKADQ